MVTNENIPTVHNGANHGDIASIVIMPGDPMRAKYIAEKYLKKFKCFNQIRGMYGYTGEYKGKKISVMASGMGIPSMGIYSYELYNFYNVDKIIRIGSCGACSKELDIADVILVDKAYSNSNFAKEFCNNSSKFVEGNRELNKHILEISKELKMNLKTCIIETSECFYSLNDIKNILKKREEEKVVAVEMETFALFNVARALNKSSASILTVSDSILQSEYKMSAVEREKKLDEMIILALETAKDIV